MSSQTLELRGSRNYSDESLVGELSDVPYLSHISQEEHRNRRIKIGEFLLREGIVSQEELPHISGVHLTKPQWEMIKDNPEDYWLIVFSNGLVDDKYQRKIEPYFDASDKSLFHIFTFNQCVWFAVHRHVAHERYLDLIARRYRAFATLKKMVFPDELVPYSRGQEIINRYYTVTSAYSEHNQLHPDFIH